MPGRRDTQQAHERAQVAAFVAWLNSRYRARYEVVAEPNPPEAIIHSGRTNRWVEVTDAFWSDAFARDEYSYATPGEKHKPIGNGPFVGPDANFAARFVDVVRKKLEKKSYLPSTETYGPGVASPFALLVEEHFVDPADLARLKEQYHRKALAAWAAKAGQAESSAWQTREACIAALNSRSGEKSSPRPWTARGDE
jgi:hypothetical protein